MNYMITVCNIIICQSVARKVIAKKEYSLKFERNTAAATKIQTAFRGYVSRMNYILTVADIITVQASFRGLHARTVAKELRRVRSDCATKIQAFTRGVQSREYVMKLRQSATLIQKTYRGFVAYENYIVNLASAILCQATIRGFLTRVELLKRKLEEMSAIKIESAFRRYVAVRRLDALRIQRLNESATIIQSRWRAFNAETEYAYVILSAISIQAFVRRQLAIDRVNQICEIRATFSSESIFKSELNACLDIQKWWAKVLVQKRTTAATKIVSCYLFIMSFIVCHMFTHLLIFVLLLSLSLLAIMFPWIPRLC